MLRGAYLTTQCHDEIHESVFDRFQLLGVTPCVDDLVQVIMRAERRPKLSEKFSKEKRNMRTCLVRKAR